MKANRKGFTITELVIVIVVIAILAAVLIPTFASLINKANIAADTQLAKNLNTSLSMAAASGEEIDEFTEVLSAAREAGYIISNLNPTAQNCYFVWESETNQILLVNGAENYKVIYAMNKEHPEIGATWYFAVSNKEAAEALRADLTAKNIPAQVPNLYADVKDVMDALAQGGNQELIIDESVVLDKENLLVVDKAGANITIDMGDAALNTSGILVEDGENVVPFAVKQGTVTVNGGVIAAAGAGVNAHNLPIKVAVRAEKGTTVNFNGTEFVNTATAAQIRIAGTANMNDVAISSSRIGVDTLDGANLTLTDTTISVTNTGVAGYRGACVLSCSYDGVSSHTGNSLVTIESGSYTTDGLGDRGALDVCGGDIVVNGGTFTAPAGKMFSVSNNIDGTITINGGTFNGKTASELGVDGLQAMCSATCSVDESNGVYIISLKK